MTDLLGRVKLRPGRPDAVSVLAPRGWLNRLAAGRGADELPSLVARVHTLCAHGHALAAQLAIRSARGEAALPSMAERESLALAVARDHLLRIAHDWPRLLPDGGAQPLPLQGCPAWRSGGSDGERLSELFAWLQQSWLQVPATTLLEQLVASPDAALRWSRRADTPLASLLRRELPAALALPTRHRRLCANEATTALPAFDVPDTGPWTRVNDAEATPAHNAGMRLIARLTDLLRLAAPGGSEWLFAQGEPVDHGQGLARVEVGRGLLCYEVGLSDDAIVTSLRVAAPTDWNLHPEGVLADALRRVDGAASAARLAVAFDPCVPFDIELREAACA